MPAAAVIPAPIAYTKVAAVKKLVVGPWASPRGLPNGLYRAGGPFATRPFPPFTGRDWSCGRLL